MELLSVDTAAIDEKAKKKKAEKERNVEQPIDKNREIRGKGFRFSTSRLDRPNNEKIIDSCENELLLT